MLRVPQFADSIWLDLSRELLKTTDISLSVRAFRIEARSAKKKKINRNREDEMYRHPVSTRYIAVKQSPGLARRIRAGLGYAEE